MKPTDTIVDEPVTIDGLVSAQLDPHQSGPGDAARGLLALDQHDQREIGQQLGFSTIADMARRFGITTPISTFPSMVLGRATCA